MAELAVRQADIIKTQFHFESEMSQVAKSTILNTATFNFDIMDQCSLSIDDEYKLKEFIESLDSCYLSTFFCWRCTYTMNSLTLMLLRLDQGVQ